MAREDDTRDRQGRQIIDCTYLSSSIDLYNVLLLGAKPAFRWLGYRGIDG